MIDRNQFNERKSAKSNIGFYIALAICIVTIAAAAWTTYGSVAEYNEKQAEESIVSSPSDVKVNNDVSNQKYESSVQQSSVTEISKVSEVSVEVSQESTIQESSFQESAELSDEPVRETEKQDIPVQPVENGTIIKKFSPENPLKSATTSDWRTHQGIDIAAKNGGAVHAVRNGIVKCVENDVMLGNIVCIEHTDGYTAYYCGLTENAPVKEGDKVYAGDTIGYIGIVPFEVLDESHLHLEVEKDGEYINPTEMFTK